MITFRISDGLGNQLFQYAAAMALARRLGAPVQFSLDYFEARTARPDRPLLLDRLFGRPLPKAGPIDTLVTRGLQKLRGRTTPEAALHIPGLAYLYFGPDYLKNFETIRDGTFVSGYFQSPAYFPAELGGSDAIRSGMAARQDEARAQLDELSNRRRAALHIRRGDYAAIANGAMVIAPERIREAVARLPVDSDVIVFSDEPDYAMSLDLGRRVEAYRSATDDPLDEFLMMSACDDFVIANSTFSWWASHLGAAPGKRILAPKDWLGPSRSAGTEAIYTAGQELY